MKKHLIVMAALCMLMTPLASADWTAYNDCTIGSVNGVDGGQNPANTTTILSNGNQTGVLKDFATGAPTGVSAQVIISGGMVYGGSGPTVNFAAGTDAANLFNGKVDMDGPVTYYGASGWYCDIILTNLDPAKKYTFATTVDRGNMSPAPSGGYTNRWSVITLQGADSSVYASSVGDAASLLKISETALSLQCYQTEKGNVAKWTDINPGSDGTITIHTTYATAGQYGPSGQDGVKAYAPAGFMVQEVVPEPATMSLLAVGGIATLIRRRNRR